MLSSQDANYLACAEQPGIPYGGHTLAETIVQFSILTNRKRTAVIVDKGYRGIEIPDARILRSEQKCGITRTLHKMFKRRSAIETIIGHMKTVGRLDRNPLKEAMCSVVRATIFAWCSKSFSLLVPKFCNRFGGFYRNQPTADGYLMKIQGYSERATYYNEVRSTPRFGVTSVNHG